MYEIGQTVFVWNGIERLVCRIIGTEGEVGDRPRFCATHCTPKVAFDGILYHVIDLNDRERTSLIVPETAITAFNNTGSSSDEKNKRN